MLQHLFNTREKRLFKSDELFNCYTVGNLHTTPLVTFGSKKKLSKHIDMGSSFEDLVATSLTVKTDFQSDKPFALQNFLNFTFRSELVSFDWIGVHARSLRARDQLAGHFVFL